jgi:hypothetical protein
MQSVTVLKRVDQQHLDKTITEFMVENPPVRNSADSITPTYLRLQEYLNSIGMEKAARMLYNSYSNNNPVIINDELLINLRDNGFEFSGAQVILFLLFMNYKKWNKMLIEKYNTGEIGVDSFTIANDFITTKNASELFTFIKGNSEFKLVLEDSNSNRVAVNVQKTSEHYNKVDNASVDALAVQLAQHISRLQGHYHTVESEMVTKFQAEISREKNSDVVEAFKKVSKFNVAGWKISEEIHTDRNNNIITNYGLVYEGKVFARQVAVKKHVFVGGSDKTLIIIPIPEDAKKKFWIANIRVPLKGTIGNVVAHGFHPHRERSNARNQHNSLCIGDLGGKSFDEIVKLPKAFETIYFHSMHMGAARNYIDRMVYEVQAKYQRGDPDTKKLIEQSGESTVFTVGTHFNT